jgi:hypothetical protein
MRMTRFKAIFAKSVDLEETEVGNSHSLLADTLAKAENEALRLHRPFGANLIKLLDEGLVVRRVWLALNA